MTMPSAGALMVHWSICFCKRVRASFSMSRVLRALARASVAFCTRLFCVSFVRSNSAAASFASNVSFVSCSSLVNFSSTPSSDVALCTRNSFSCTPSSRLRTAPRSPNPRRSCLRVNSSSSCASTSSRRASSRAPCSFFNSFV